MNCAGDPFNIWVCFTTQGESVFRYKHTHLGISISINISISTCFSDHQGYLLSVFRRWWEHIYGRIGRVLYTSDWGGGVLMGIQMGHFRF